MGNDFRSGMLIYRVMHNLKAWPKAWPYCPPQRGTTTPVFPLPQIIMDLFATPWSTFLTFSNALMWYIIRQPFDSLWWHVYPVHTLLSAISHLNQWKRRLAPTYLSHYIAPWKLEQWGTRYAVTVSALD